MKNIFSQTKDYVKPPKRNVFDLSFRNNGTFQFGYLYPVFCKEVIPGDSFKIDPTFALRFLPTAFPVQTKINANLHFFYVRNRNLWDGWQKFIGHTGDVEFPYLDGTQDSIKTSGLADYLGVPTTIISGESNTLVVPFNGFFSLLSDSGSFYSYVSKSGSDLTDTEILQSSNLLDKYEASASTSGSLKRVLIDRSNVVNNQIPRFPYTLNCRAYSENLTGARDLEINFVLCGTIGSRYTPICTFNLDGSVPPKGSATSLYNVTYNITPYTSFYFSTNPTQEVNFSTPQEFYDFVKQNFPSQDYRLALISKSDSNNVSERLFPVFQKSTPQSNNDGYVSSFSYRQISLDPFVDYENLVPSDKAFLTTNTGSVRLSALPFRAYESIYNAFYRNDQNDPLMIDGNPEYDTYVPNTNDGSDSYPYKLYKRNWELDFLTSAVQSPQQGIAPLVGVSQSGDFTFVHKDSDGNIGYFTAKASLASDGSSITGVELSDKVSLDGLPTTPITANIPEDVKRGSIYSLKQMALAGISINDFRNVNALQRWLETNIRRGYKYRDQIKSHFGIDLDYQVLDMPEFIGGISQAVYSSQVNQTTETETDPLGSYAGQLSLIASSNHSIKHYCHEHGFIIGIFSVTPVPNYSQLLPKHFIKYNYLDYYFPEFGHIGMQPIDYREVCPLQAYGVDPKNLLNTFGYQRPWYDYIASVDEVHGLFRTNLRNFVLNRQFSTLPMLNKDFLQVDPEQLNDVFTINDVSDKILGQIQFNVIAKRPIPKFGIPRLE